MGMKKLTKAQKAECPQYVLRIDFLSIGTGKGYEYVILKENTMGLAIKTAENIIDKFGRDNVYLADIFEKTTKEKSTGLLFTTIPYEHVYRLMRICPMNGICAMITIARIQYVLCGGCGRMMSILTDIWMICDGRQNNEKTQNAGTGKIDFKRARISVVVL